MKRINPDTQQPFKFGDKREDGYLFYSYQLHHTLPTGFFSEVWMEPDKWHHKREQNKTRGKKRYRALSDEQKLYEAVRSRANSNGIPFTITQEDVVIPDVCPVLGIELIRGAGSVTDNSPSIDKIDPAKGYVKGNICIMSLRANRIKNDATIDEVRKLLSFLESVS